MSILKIIDEAKNRKLTGDEKLPDSMPTEVPSNGTSLGLIPENIPGFLVTGLEYDRRAKDSSLSERERTLAKAHTKVLSSITRSLLLETFEVPKSAVAELTQKWEFFHTPKPKSPLEQLAAAMRGDMCKDCTDTDCGHHPDHVVN